MISNNHISLNRTNGIRISRFLFCLMSVFSFAVILRNPDVAIKYMTDGLSLCANTVIPSLFPFMAISELLVASGIGKLIGKVFAVPMRFLFGISGAASCAFILGVFCGFPVGAKTAVSLYDRGEVSRSEFERVLTFSNIPGSAFLSSTVGVSLFADKSIGNAMFASVFISALIIGFFGKFIYKYSKNAAEPFIDTSSTTSQERRFEIKEFTNSISHAAQSMLTVCAFVVFFSAFVGVFENLLASLSLPDTSKALAFGLFEITAGVSRAAALADRQTALLLCAFICGWSGLSVHFQIMSVCTDKNRGISFVPYFLSKLIQGFLCTAIIYIYIRFIDPSILLSAPTVDANASFFPPVSYIVAVNVIFLLTLLAICASGIKNKRQKTAA